jgi:hypothetical protein
VNLTVIGEKPLLYITHLIWDRREQRGDRCSQHRTARVLPERAPKSTELRRESPPPVQYPEQTPERSGIEITRNADADAARA